MTSNLKVIIAGCRNYNNKNQAFIHLDAIHYRLQISGYVISEIFCGMAAGADTLGYEWAQENNIPIYKFYANWNEYGKAAGPKRNIEMANGADFLIAFWDGYSKGTYHMIKTMKKYNKPYIIINITTQSITDKSMGLLTQK